MKTKKSLFIDFVLFALLILAVMLSGCKKKEVPLPLPPVKAEKVTEADFVLKILKKLADQNKLEGSEVLPVSIDTAKVKIYDAQKATVTRFKSSPEWTYSELKPVLKKIPLTVVDGTGLPVWKYEDFLDYWKPGESFIVLDPKPVYHVQFWDGQVVKREYWINSEGNLWHTR